jgi:hypothetical protein
MRTLMIAAVAVLAISATDAAEPDRPSLERLVRVLYPHPEISAQFYLMRAEGAYADTIIHMRWKEPTAAQINGIHHAMNEEIAASVTPEDFREIVISAYSQRFTQEEISAALAFFESNAGRAWLDKNGMADKDVSDALVHRAQTVFNASLTKLLNEPMPDDQSSK